jgi:hypothetical protein
MDLFGRGVLIDCGCCDGGFKELNSGIMSGIRGGIVSGTIRH